MVVGTTAICDFCYERCLPDDFTTVHLEKAGQPVEFTFHNRHASDCLAQKLLELRARFSENPFADTPEA